MKTESIPQIIFFRHDSETQGDVMIREEQESEPSKEPGIVCVFCGTVITSPSERTEIDGSHAHTFLNPSGFVFRVGCFSSAPGCISQGEMTDEFSWFRGFKWNYTICSGCSHHMGWHYLSGNNHFYGLILDYLAEGI